MKEHVIIVGGGFGGLTLARRLAHSGLKITLIDKSNHHLFQPLLYQVASAALSPGDVAEPIRSVLGRYRNVDVLLAEVTKVDKEHKKVYLKNGRELSFDKLILAPGTVYNYFGNEEWKQYAYSLKSIADAIQIRERIFLSLEKAEQINEPALREPWLTFVIVGGGPTGVEMAGAIAEIAKRNMMRDYKRISKNETRIFLVEAESRILSQYPEHLSEKAREILEDMGVSVLAGTPVKNIVKDRVDFGKSSIHTPNIIWAAGVKGVSLADSLEVEQDSSGRVYTEPDLSLPGHPDIFVIGDAALVRDEEGNALPALAPVAIQQAEFLVKYLTGKKEKGSRFTYLDKGNMATIGRAKAVADIRGLTFSGFFAWLLWSFIHILFLIGFRNRFRVFMEWIWHYFTFKRGVRLITGKNYLKEDTLVHAEK
ncbi:NAD(P)/FAD-dependent oxidoreductase [Balneolaceae bacterium ANBcel3]|nr:NAD(P)/FAD-dependent oxidoreductase [Balneolaceae bacterium ANBcel3]